MVTATATAYLADQALARARVQARALGQVQDLMRLLAILTPAAMEAAIAAMAMERAMDQAVAQGLVA